MIFFFPFLLLLELILYLKTTTTTKKSFAQVFSSSCAAVSVAEVSGKNEGRVSVFSDDMLPSVVSKPIGEQPRARIAIEKTVVAIQDQAFIKAPPSVLGLKNQNVGWVTADYGHANPSNDDRIGVFSPSNFSTNVQIILLLIM